MLLVNLISSTKKQTYYNYFFNDFISSCFCSIHFFYHIHKKKFLNTSCLFKVAHYKCLSIPI